jgi:hypothetical protein
VTRDDGRPAERTRAEYVSSDSTVVRILDSPAGFAFLASGGTAEITATFDEPRVPGGPLTANTTINVTDLAVELTLSSVASATIEAGDTLVGDSVQFGVTVVIAGDTIPIVSPSFTSSNPAVVEFVNPTTGRAFFADSGTATVTVGFTELGAPRYSTSEPFRVTTYVASIGGPSGPTMGDTVTYTVTAVDTRDGKLVATSGAVFESSDASVLRVLDPGGGVAFVRDIGQTEVRVRLGEPALPYRSVEAATTVQVSEERFYGTTSATSGDFGDVVRLTASPVHRFSDSTWVAFSNGAPAFVESATPFELEFSVGAASASGPLQLRNLVDDVGQPRSFVLTNWTFEGQGTVEDQFEPNDAFPLTSKLEIKSLPWDELLSSDPQKTAPADTNFFWFRLNRKTTLDFNVEWQQDADLDFKVCRGDKRPPVGYKRDKGVPICAREPSQNSQDRMREEAVGLQLAKATWVVAFYCIDCPTLPLTYRVRISGSDDDD